MSSNNGKIFIANIVLAVLAVVSIITLWTGSFMKIDLNIKLDSESLNKIMDNSEGVPPGEGEATQSEEEIRKLLNSIDVELPLVIDLKSSTMIKSIAKGPENKILEEIIGTQTEEVVDILMEQIEKIFPSIVTLTVDAVVADVEKEIKEQIKNELAMQEEDISDEEIAARLEEEYGITQNDIDELKKDISDSASALLNGEYKDVPEILENSNTFDKLVVIYAEQEIKNEKGEDYVPTQSEIEEKHDSLKSEAIGKCDEVLEKMKNENGEFSQESIVVGFANQLELKDENENPVTFNNVEDIKTYTVNKINSAIEKGEISDAMSKAFSAIGIFILIVIAAWAYLIVKIVAKLFMRNKAVKVRVPQFFGWMPHVFFVGLPMMVVKFIDKAIVSGMESSAEMQTISEFLSMITLKFSSLTWISALCSVLLLVIWIPYRRWRKESKRR